jgi:hypothetical protein
MTSGAIISLLGPAYAFRSGAPLSQRFDLFSETLADQSIGLGHKSRVVWHVEISTQNIVFDPILCCPILCARRSNRTSTAWSRRAR